MNILDRYMNMSLEEKRKHYSCMNGFVPYDEANFPGAEKKGN